MKVIYCQDAKTCEIREIDGSLESMQKLVDGLIPVLYLSRELCVVVNEEGRLRNMPFNRMISGHILVGPIFFAKVSGEDIVGFTDEVATSMLELVA